MVLRKGIHATRLRRYLAGGDIDAIMYIQRVFRRHILNLSAIRSYYGNIVNAYSDVRSVQEQERQQLDKFLQEHKAAAVQAFRGLERLDPWAVPRLVGCHPARKSPWV